MNQPGNAFMRWRGCSDPQRIQFGETLLIRTPSPQLGSDYFQASEDALVVLTDQCFRWSIYFMKLLREGPSRVGNYIQRMPQEFTQVAGQRQTGWKRDSCP
jgi:hypothetical protein